MNKQNNNKNKTQQFYLNTKTFLEMKRKRNTKITPQHQNIPQKKTKKLLTIYKTERCSHTQSSSIISFSFSDVQDITRCNKLVDVTAIGYALWEIPISVGKERKKKYNIRALL